MCQFTAPPGVFFAGPLQYPGGWLSLVIDLVSLVVGGLIGSWLSRAWRRRRPFTLDVRNIVGIALAACGAFVAWTSLIRETLIVQAYAAAEDDWETAQYARLDAHHCPSAVFTNFFAAADTALHRTDGVSQFDSKLLLVAAGLLVLALAWMALTRLSLLARSARQ